MSIPEDLRDVLETCLAEDATPDNLAIYLPKVRAIITRLLQGLRTKQSLYRRIVADQPHASRHRSHARTNSRSSKADKPRQDDDIRQRRSQLSRSQGDDERVERESTHSRHVSRPSHASKPSDSQLPRMTPPPVFQEPDDDPPADKLPNGQHPPVLQPTRSSQPVPAEPPARAGDAEAPAAHVPVPPNVKRYSLVDKPVSSPPRSPPTVVIEEPSPGQDTNGDPSPPRTPPPDTPAVQSSLAALKKSEALERRASKRFSTYHFSKMTGAKERTVTSPNRRSMAASSALTPGDLAVLTEVDEPEVKREKRMPKAPSPAEAPPVPPLPPSVVENARPTVVRVPTQLSKVMEEAEPEPEATSAFSVFLQVGREVKKVVLEPGLTFASLRVLFVDKFSYNPGMENFPAIYIRDPASGVQYELEDIDEVKDKCLLSLNIERASSF